MKLLYLWIICHLTSFFYISLFISSCNFIIYFWYFLILLYYCSFKSNCENFHSTCKLFMWQIVELLMNNNSFCNSIYLAAYKVLMECKIFRCNKIFFNHIINDIYSIQNYNFLCSKKIAKWPKNQIYQTYAFLQYQ